MTSRNSSARAGTEVSSARTREDEPDRGLLDGVRVLEMGHFIAAPFGSRILADLGADVIKIEPPGAGDPIRQWGARKEGESLWWSVHARNKRCITLDLKHPDARAVVLSLVAECDAVMENFRPGWLARHGLDDETLRQARPGLVIVHVSGFGQTGPKKDRAAFGVIGEAMGGLRYLTNHAPGTQDLPPIRVGVSIGDAVAGLYGALGLVAGLLRQKNRGDDTRGATLDVALTESIFSLLEGALPEYGALGIIRQPSGSTLPTTAPTNAYPTADGLWLLIAANSDALFKRLATAMGQPALPRDPRFAGNVARVAHAAELDALIGDWTRQHDSETLEALMAKADVPATRAYTIADCAADEQFLARDMIRTLDDPLLGPVLHPGVVPQVAETPSRIRWPGPRVGQHNDEILGDLLGLSPAVIQSLRDRGVC